MLQKRGASIINQSSLQYEILNSKEQYPAINFLSSFGEPIYIYQQQTVDTQKQYGLLYWTMLGIKYAMNILNNREKYI